MSWVFRAVFGRGPTNEEAASALREQRGLMRRARVAMVAAGAPDTVRSLEVLVRRRGRQSMLHSVQYVARLVIDEHALRSGQVPQTVRVSATLDAETGYTAAWWKRQQARGHAAYALAARVEGYDARGSAIDTIWRLGIECAEPSPAAGGESACPLVVNGGTAPDLAATPHELLALPLVHTEPTLDVQFASIQAIGFDPSKLYENVAKRVGSDYFIPYAYAFAGLIQRVNACCAIAELRRSATSALAVETAPLAAYTLPRSKSHFMIGAAALERAVRFITERLVRANASFDPTAVSFGVAPFGETNWVTPWQAALDLAYASRANDAPAAAANGIEIVLRATVYFALLPTAGLGGLRVDPVADEVRTYASGNASPRSAATLDEISSYALPPSTTASDDSGDDDDDEMSLTEPPPDKK